MVPGSAGGNHAVGAEGGAGGRWRCRGDRDAAAAGERYAAQRPGGKWDKDRLRLRRSRRGAHELHVVDRSQEVTEDRDFGEAQPDGLPGVGGQVERQQRRRFDRGIQGLRLVEVLQHIARRHRVHCCCGRDQVHPVLVVWK